MCQDYNSTSIDTACCRGRDTFVVIDGPRLAGSAAVNLRTGVVAAVNNDVRLGHDRRGRLYASRYLNPVPSATVAPPQIGEQLTSSDGTVIAEKDESGRWHDVN